MEIPMPRTYAYVSNFELLINRAPEGAPSGAPADPQEKWWECEEQLNVISRAATTLRIIADACGNGAYTNTENVEESLSRIVDTLNGVCERMHSLLNLPGSKANA
jgi:hypothetical protein